MVVKEEQGCMAIEYFYNYSFQKWKHNEQTKKTIFSWILNELGTKGISTNFLAYRNQSQFWDIKQTIFNKSSLKI